MMRIAIAQLNPTVGALKANRERLEAALEQARSNHAQMLVSSELALTGYPPEDLLLLPDFIDATEQELERLLPATRGLVALIGTVRRNPHGPGKPLCDTVAICQDGKLLGFQDKSLLPTYDVFDEARYFQPAPSTRIWPLLNQRIAITVCEDVWGGDYACDPINELIPDKPDLLINLSASPYSVERETTRFEIFSNACKRLHCPGILVNQVGGNDSLIFDGHSMLCGPDGHLRAHAKGFSEDFQIWDTEVLPPPATLTLDFTQGLHQALVLGIRDYFHKQGFQSAILGLSGGIDSALVACLAAEALGSQNVTAVALPSRFTSRESLEDARQLANALHITLHELPIEPLFTTTLSTLQPLFKDRPWDITEENIQARLRGLLLMAMANKDHQLLLNTGNKSEMAMGYFTLYGDSCGALAVLSDVTKAQVYNLAQHFPIPPRIIQKAPTAELKHNQLDSDTLPPYPILDTIVVDYVEKHERISNIPGPREAVDKVIRTIHRNEFKRRQAPLGLRVTPKAFSKGRMFPIVQGWMG